MITTDDSANDFTFIKLMLISLGIEESLIEQDSRFVEDMEMDTRTLSRFILMVESYFQINVDVNITPVLKLNQLQRLIQHKQFINSKTLNI